MKWAVTLALCLFLGSSLATNFKGLSRESLTELFKQEIKAYHLTKQPTDLYNELLSAFRFPKHLKSNDFEDTISPKNDFMCTLCNSVLGAYVEMIREGATESEVTESVMELCTILNISTERVCRGAIESNIYELAYIVTERPNLSTPQLCGIVFQSSCPSDDLDVFEWTVNVDPNQPALTGSKDTSVAPSASDLKFAQITDPHYDSSYMTGSWAACDEYNCCRYDQPLPAAADASEGAGRWGDYRDCDSPLDAVVDAFTQIQRQNPDLDYVYFTGDIVDHAVWAITTPHVKASITRVHTLLKNVFGNTPVFPVLGNHEAHPVNQFAPASVPERFSSQWLYSFVAEEWRTWLPESALETVRIGGYYTVLVRPGFRIIALNNNECYTFNWWVAYTRPEVAREQLQWMHDTLLEAESNGEKVHILGHVPPGSGGCWRIYSREYRRIIDRFWNTVSAQFAGHSHRDEFYIFYARDNPNQALNVMWNGGSTTAYSHVNPNYKIYTMDQTTYQINSQHTWIYNLTLANLFPNVAPYWFKEYDFQEEYGLDNLSPRALSGLMDTFSRSPQLLHRFWELKFNMADTTLAEGCDSECLGNHLCSIVTTEVFNSPRCTELLSIWNGE